ncbi:MAG: Fic family protein [Candidatus Micrarchaeota archaeon]
MSRIIKRKVKGKQYYYLEESIKKRGKWVKESVYLGDAIPENKKLLAIYNEFEKKLRKQGVKGITPPYTEFITHKIAEKIEEVTVKKQQFVKSLSPKEREKFAQRERVTFITDSNAIEGSTLNYALTERVVSDQERMEKLKKQGYTITGMGREEQEALNLNKCLNLYEKYLLERAKISEEMMLKLHLILLNDISGYEKYVGIWRPVNVMIRGSDHVFPHHAQVQALMKELIAWYNENSELIQPVELAAKFHTKFTAIHPFADGNGRMARLLMNYILQTKNAPFTNIPLSKRNEYMKTQAAGNKNDLKPFTLFLAKQIIEQTKETTKNNRN